MGDPRRPFIQHSPRRYRVETQRERGVQEARPGLGRSPKSQSVAGANQDSGSGEPRAGGRPGGVVPTQGGVPLAARCKGRTDALEGTEGRGAPASGHSTLYSKMRASCPAWPRRRVKAPPHPERPGSARGRHGAAMSDARAPSQAKADACPPAGSCPAASPQLSPSGTGRRELVASALPTPRPPPSSAARHSSLTIRLVPHASCT